MAVIRVYLPTYRRPHMLRRALESLQKQTFQDWVCEVHNDSPGDEEPARMVLATGDARISIINHERNLGGTATFNLFFNGCAEPYMSLLEDDNWWEPAFLSSMLDALKAHPTITVAWSNMRFWQEEADGSWTDTKRLIWPNESSLAPRLFHWAEVSQAFGAVHSNGAMLVRTEQIQRFRIPNIGFSAIEPFRERTFPWPLLFVPSPLANFSLTRQTHRSRDGRSWGTLQILLAATFAESWADTPERLEQLWEYARSKRQRVTNTLLGASFQGRNLARLRSPASFKERLWFFAGIIRHPVNAWATLRTRKNNVELWGFLEKHTRERFAEAKKQAMSDGSSSRSKR